MKIEFDGHFHSSFDVSLSPTCSFDKPDMNEREIPIQPKDEVLGHLLNKFPDKVYKYHEHQSLLDNKHEQELTEEEKQEAFRRHRNMKNRTATETSSTGE